MTCPKCHEDAQRYVPTDHPSRHDPGRAAYYECRFCGHEDYRDGEAAVDYESDKADWEYEQLKDAQLMGVDEAIPDSDYSGFVIFEEDGK